MAKKRVGKEGKEKKEPSKKRLKLRWLRLLSQLSFLSLFLLALMNIAPLMPWLTIPVSTPYSAFSMFQTMLSTPILPLLPTASILLFTILPGRSLCGWVCPSGLIQDILCKLKRKHTKITPETHSWLKNIKYLILGATLLVSCSLALSLTLGIGGLYKKSLGAFSTAPYTILSPEATVFILIPESVKQLQQWMATSPLIPLEQLWAIILQIPPLFYVRLVIAAVFIISSIYIPRFWCLYFCPVGAMMAILSQFSLLGMKRDITKCTRIRACVEKCPMRVRVLDLPWEKFNDPECTLCLDCVDACPRKALKPKFP